MDNFHEESYENGTSAKHKHHHKTVRTAEVCREKKERRQERERSAEKGNWVFMQSVPCSFWFGPKFGFRENSKMTCRAGVLLLRVGEAQLVETR